MKKRVNPAVIGAFVIGGVVLAIGALGVLGSGLFRTSTETFVCYFEESVNGLDVGGSVKFKGVKVGQVKQLGIYYDPEATSTYVPVLIEINMDLLADRRIRNETADEELMAKQIASGLRAQLQLESIISGVLFVDLDVRPQLGSPVVLNISDEYPEIATVPSPLSEIGQTASDMVASLNRIDIQAITDTVITTLENANAFLSSLELQQMSQNIAGAAAAMQNLMESESIERTLTQVQAATAELQAMTQALRVQASPALARIDTVGMTLTATLTSLQGAVERVDRLFAPETVIGHNIEETLVEMSNAAQAVRQLAEYLERNPRALITGKARTNE